MIINIDMLLSGNSLGAMNETSDFGMAGLTVSSTAQPIYVGSGGTADCFRVNHHGKWLLMKRLKPEFAASERHRQALAKEYEIGATIDHPNIVRYQYLDDDGTYLLQDYVDGLTLDKFIKQQPDFFRKKSHRQRFLDQLLSAVACLHAHQVVHLDLCPANIIITTRGHSVKLIDLGMAFSDTYTSTYGGTKDYTAPEVKDKTDTVAASADIYSIGRIMACIGCKERHVVSHCLRYEASRRYQSVDELRQAIVSSHRRRGLLLAIAIVAVALVVGIAFLLSQRENDIGPKPSQKTAEQQPATPRTERENTLSPSRGSDIPHPSNTQENLRYKAAMSEIRKTLITEKQRIYAAADKQLAQPDYSNHNLYADLRKTLVDCHRQLGNKEKQLYADKGCYMSRSFADSVSEDYFARLEQINKTLHERDDAQEAAAKARQEQLYKHIVKAVDEAYAPIVRLVQSPPASKETFRKQFLSLKEKAESVYAAALQQGYQQYGATLSEKQSQQISEKINLIEEKFYTKYNEK